MTPNTPVSLWPDPDALGPVTDLYELTMMAGYLAAGMESRRATFELFVRRLPEQRQFLVFAGLEQAIDDLLRLAFSREQVEWLRRLPAFASISASFFDWLECLRFRGDVWAVPEGTVVFPGEPLVRVEASLSEAQWLETILIAALGYPTLVASKAARIVEAAGVRPVYDFGARRGHGPHASFLAARASYLAGCAGTSQAEAARRLGIPCVGTMAHSWVQSFATEADAFATFARIFPKATTILVDTYDTAHGVELAAALEPPVQAIRIDSGDLARQAKDARSLLDRSGRASVKIFGSGDLDEDTIAELLAAGAPFDAFGVGTNLITSRDAPALSMVYKLVAMDGQGRVKLSPGKRTYPLAKQVHRFRDAAGRFERDHVTCADESEGGEPLLVPIVRAGQLVRPWPSLEVVREHARRQVDALPAALRALHPPAQYPVSYSAALDRAAEGLGLRPLAREPSETAKPDDAAISAEKELGAGKTRST